MPICECGHFLSNHDKEGYCREDGCPCTVYRDDSGPLPLHQMPCPCPALGVPCQACREGVWGCDSKCACHGTGYRFWMLGRDCPGPSNEYGNPGCALKYAPQNVWAGCICNGSGRIRVGDAGALLAAARHAGFPYLSFEPSLDDRGKNSDGLIIFFMRETIGGVPWKGVGATDAEALDAAILAAVAAGS